MTEAELSEWLSSDQPSRAWAVLTLDWSAPATPSPSKSSPTPIAATCSNGTGQASPDTTTYALSTGSHGADASTFSLAASPAKTYPWRANGQDSPEQNPGSFSSSPESQMMLLDTAVLFYSKTSVDSCPVIAAEISPSFSRRWPNSGFTMSPGEFSTANTSECPNGGGASSSLADVVVGRSCAAILLEPESGGGDFEARRTPKPRAAHRTQDGIARTVQTRGRRQDGDTDDFIIANPVLAGDGAQRSTSVERSYWIEDFRNGTLTADPGRSDRKPIIVGATPDANGMRAATGLPGRVDGAPDDPRPDGRRYAAVGDAVTVNVAEWIGRRLNMEAE
jgi:hypothetical protein